MQSLLLCVWLVVMGCGEGADRKASVYASANDDPKDTDSLYKLLRRTLVDSNPRAIYQAYACEMARLRDRLGMETTRRRVYALLDTVYRTTGEQMRRVEVDSKLGGAGATLDKKHCGPDFKGFEYRPRDSSRASGKSP